MPEQDEENCHLLSSLLTPLLLNIKKNNNFPDTKKSVWIFIVTICLQMRNGET